MRQREIFLTYYSIAMCWMWPMFCSGKACIKKILLSNCLQELMELHQVSLDEGLVKSICVISFYFACIYWMFPGYSTLGKRGGSHRHRTGWKLVFFDFSSTYMWWVCYLNICKQLSFCLVTQVQIDFEFLFVLL